MKVDQEMKKMKGTHVNLCLVAQLITKVMTKKRNGIYLRNPSLNIFIALVSSLSVLNSLLFFLPYTDVALVNIIILFNWVIEIIFITNFFYRLTIADSRSKYIRSKEGVIDLLACIPFIQISWIFRGLNAFFIFRDLGVDQFRKDLSRGRANATVLTVLFVMVLILEFGSYSVILAERGDPHANITSAEIALWWVFETITTVGYGDYTPITLGGRVVGVIVMAAGIGTYALLAGYFAKVLIGQRDKTNDNAPEDKESISNPQELMVHLRELEGNDQELSERLERIEQLLSSWSKDEHK